LNDFLKKFPGWAFYIGGIEVVVIWFPPGANKRGTRTQEGAAAGQPGRSGPVPGMAKNAWEVSTVGGKPTKAINNFMY
jgi:hypothetical protein